MSLIFFLLKIKQVFVCFRNYYSAFALVADPVDGPIFSSLLVGPCALEYTKLKTIDHLWADPNADELIQRYRMHSICKQSSLGNSFNSNNTSFTSNNSSLSVTNNSSSISNNSSSFHCQTPKQKLGLNASIILKRNATTNSSHNNNLSIEEANNSSLTSPISCNTSTNNNNGLKSPLTPTSYNSNPSPTGSVNSNNSSNAKEYVESLHQNSKSQLIYGKNHVIVYPV